MAGCGLWAHRRARSLADPPWLETGEWLGQRCPDGHWPRRVHAGQLLRCASGSEDHSVGGQLPAPAQPRLAWRGTSRAWPDRRLRAVGACGTLQRKRTARPWSRSGSAGPQSSGHRAIRSAPRARHGGKPRAGGSSDYAAAATHLSDGQSGRWQPGLTNAEPIGRGGGIALAERSSQVAPMIWLYWRRSRFAIAIAGAALGALA